MDPRDNDPRFPQPQPPQTGQIANQQGFSPPRPQPDWQRGLGGVQPPQVPTGADTGVPSATETPSMPGNAPDVQVTNPVPTTQQAGELPSPTAYSAQPQPAAYVPPSQPAAPAPMTPPRPAMSADMPPYAESGNKAKPMLAVISIVIVIALLAGALYFFFNHKPGSNNGANTGGNSSAAKDITKVGQISLSPPSTIAGFTERKTGTAAIKDFVANDGSCELIAGVTTAAQLPGKDLSSIVQPQIDQVRKAGATVAGPAQGEALVLKDADDNAITYSLPTLTYGFVQGDKHVIFHYSVAILQNGDRAVVNRVCNNQGAEVDAAKMAALDASAKQILVMRQ